LGQQTGGSSQCAGERHGQAGRYDAIICMEVLEHVVRGLSARSAERWLAPAGCLLISVPVKWLALIKHARHVPGWFGVGVIREPVLTLGRTAAAFWPGGTHLAVHRSPMVLNRTNTRFN
jgi:2-polyprenyl-3-methyl-5-hydroxy-6-metoxy-1,4-benzoquinol methylase